MIFSLQCVHLGVISIVGTGMLLSQRNHDLKYTTRGLLLTNSCYPSLSIRLHMLDLYAVNRNYLSLVLILHQESSGDL